MNALDAVLLLLIGLAALSGFRRGAVLQLFTYSGLLAGLFVGAIVAPRLAGLAQDPLMQSALALGGLLLIAAIGDVVGWIVGARLASATKASRFRPVDSAGGSVVAIVALLLASWFVAINVAQGPFPIVARQVGGSAIIRGLDEALPDPPSVVGGVRRFLDRFGFPEVFAGLPVAPAGPVDPPSDAQANRAFRAAGDSTVQVVGEACGRIQEGSGFVVADAYVMTNAHVVAGVDSPRVIDDDGTQDAVVVVFDPRLDVAVLRVAEAPGPVLDLAEPVDRGAKGAVLGYPEGQGLTGKVAAVRRALSAIGRDIYGRDRVIRQVYELQAVVRPGNSGGPFVLVDGDVAGVVFAASSTDENVGYAITSAEVEPLLDRAVASASPLGTGPCIR